MAAWFRDNRTRTERRTREGGAFAGDRTSSIPSVACYIPRGKGSFPSVALMTTLPAKVAGVKNIAILTSPFSHPNCAAGFPLSGNISIANRFRLIHLEETVVGP